MPTPSLRPDHIDTSPALSKSSKIIHRANKTALIWPLLYQVIFFIKTNEIINLL